MGGRSLDSIQTSKVKSLRGWTGHQSKVAFVWKNLGWEVLVLWSLCGTSGSPSIPHDFWGSHLIPGVAHQMQGPPQLPLQMHRAWSEKVWGARAPEALPRWKVWLSSVFTEASSAFVRSDRCKHLLAPQNAACQETIQVWALKAGLQKGWAPLAAGNRAGDEGGRHF